MTFIDLRDRYGLTQLVVDSSSAPEVLETAAGLGREFVIQAKGRVLERASKNPHLPTGEVEVAVEALKVLNPAKTPPFTIEENSDGGETLRAKFRYLDLRRPPLQRALALRHRFTQEVRYYLDSQDFMEIETPFLIKSTPEGARDFVVPSRMNPGQFYALPQSPQQQKQLLMVAGYDRYFQIVRCFRDEDLRADRQPEFTQIDCEMSFVEREDVLQMFEGMMRQLFKKVLNLDMPEAFPRMSFAHAMENYGCDKPDIRFGMTIKELTPLAQGRDFAVFNQAQYVGAICVKGGAAYTRKQTDELTEWVKRPQVGAKGMVFVRATQGENGLQYKSTVDKFYNQEDLAAWGKCCEMEAGDLLCILCGERKHSLEALGTLRIEMGNRLGLRDPKVFAPLWVYDFPLLEWDEETQRFYAMHHPFTSPKPEDLPLFYSQNKEDLAKVCANAYDFVLNGTELGGGSIRIHDSAIQQRMFEVLGFSPEEIEARFGFLIHAFSYGAPPHGGIAFGLDRCCALFGGQETIRDYIAFPKNNTGRDVMLDAPSAIDQVQLDELFLDIKPLP